MKCWIYWLVLVAGAAVLPSAAVQAQILKKDHLRESPQTLQAFRSVVASASQATVRVKCDGKDAALGTVVAADGWIVTKASELHGEITCTLKSGCTLAARLVGVHKPYDLA